MPKLTNQRRYKNPMIKNIIRLCRQIDVKIGSPDVAGEPVTPVEDIQWAYRMACELQDAAIALQNAIFDEYTDRVQAWSEERQTELFAGTGEVLEQDDWLV